MIGLGSDKNIYRITKKLVKNSRPVQTERASTEYYVWIYPNFAFPYCFIGMKGWLCRICEVHVTHTKERDSAPSPSPRLFAGNKCLSVTSVYNAVENAACLHPGGKFLKPVFFLYSKGSNSFCDTSFH